MRKPSRGTWKGKIEFFTIPMKRWIEAGREKPQGSGPLLAQL
jgi:hypothetical protein